MSLLSSPIPIGSTNDYVVFVSTGEVVDRYDWTFEYVGAAQTHRSTTEVGVTSHMPALLDLLQVTVELTLAGGGIVTISMIQEVRPRFTGFEFFFDAAPVPATVVDQPTVAALGGDPAATEELANDFRTYVLAAAAGTSLPPRLLAAFAYHGSMQAPKLDQVGPFSGARGRDQKLEWVASELNGDRWNLATDIDDRLGVCQLLLAVATMTVGPNGTGGATYTPWRERAADGSDASTVDEAIRTDFDQLTLDDQDRPVQPRALPADEHRAVRRAARPAARPPQPVAGSHRRRADRASSGARDTGIRVRHGCRRRSATHGREGRWGDGAEWRRQLDRRIPAPGRRVDPVRRLPAGGSRQLRRLPAAAWRQRCPAPVGRRRCGRRRQPAAGSHVRQLQDDLSELGFALVADDLAGVFDMNTEWAVRELQVYAKMRLPRDRDRARRPALRRDASNRRSTSTTTPARSPAWSTSARGS